MEVALEMEDDLFFADLSKQISLLIMEEDDIRGVADLDPIFDPYWQYSPSLQGFSRSANQPSAAPPSTRMSGYDQINRGWEASKGTGVFIPKSSQPRRKNRTGRFRSSPSSRLSSQRQTGAEQHDQYYNGLNRSGPSPFISHKNSFNTGMAKKF